MCAQKRARVSWTEKDRNGRTLGRVWCGGIDSNAEQVRRGMAWVFDRHVKDRSLYPRQDAAKADRLGLWADAAPIAPWEWRHAKGQSIERENDSPVVRRGPSLYETLRREDKQSLGEPETIKRRIITKKGGVLMNSYVAARALAALDEIRGLLQAAQFAAQKFEQQVMTQEPVESLSGHIHRAKTAADMLRARIQRSARRAVVGQLPHLGR